MTVQINLRQLALDLNQRRYTDRLNLREVSKLVNVSPSTLSRLEQGRMPDLVTYIVVCRYLNRPFNHYFTLDQ